MRHQGLSRIRCERCGETVQVLKPEFHDAVDRQFVVGCRLAATGRLFAAFHNAELTEPIILQELAELETSQSASYGIDEAWFRKRVDLVRRQGYDTTLDIPIPGVSAIAAPIFDHTGSMELAITLIGPTPVIDLEPDGAAVGQLLAFTDLLSEDLGYMKEPNPDTRS